MPTYKQIFENNKKWVAEKKGTDENFFENLSKGYNPDFFIGCCDNGEPVED